MKHNFILFVIALLISFVIIFSTSDNGGLMLLDEVETPITNSYTPISSRQERINTIVSSFRKLPDKELDRLGISFDREILEGTPDELKLFEAWNQRQKELKDAMESITKPVEMMANISSMLQSRTMTVQDIDNLLIELESLVADVDNARDFHTIGGWNVLTSYLLQDKSTSNIRNAAWVIGTAVQNDYDYQLWTLETINNTSLTVINQLVSLFSLPFSEVYEQDEYFHPRILYAISSSTRGNVGVQESLLSTPVFLSTLRDLGYNDFTENVAVIKRKIWNLVVDMIQERTYIRVDLKGQFEQNSTETLSIDNMQLLGDHFCNFDWMQIALKNLGDVLNVDEYFLKPNVKATLLSILTTIDELLFHCIGPESRNSISKMLTSSINQILILSKNDSNEELLEISAVILKKLVDN